MPPSQNLFGPISDVPFFLGELVKLTRFEHALMLAFAVLVAETMILHAIPQVDALLLVALLVPIFSEMGAFSLNDYFDVETDRLNKKQGRPLVAGTISTSFALWFSALCLLLSILLSLLLNMNAFTIALLFNLLAVAYNWKLKDLPLIGNAYIALTMAIPFIFGNFVVSTSLSGITLVLAILGFVAGLAREIIKSVQDMDGDAAARKSNTLPVVIGKYPSLVFACLLYLVFVPLSAVPFLFFGLAASFLPILLVAVADLLLFFISYKLLMSHSESAFSLARNISLVAFALGLVGLLLAALSTPA